jgi:sigma-B regulation protein RsbU (phosphoserine phosphatase)
MSTDEYPGMRIREELINRALRLVEDLLDFTQARMGSGMTVRRREADIHHVVAGAIGAIDTLRLAFPQRGLVHVHEGGGPCLADANRLTQLVGNLVGNAAAYGDPENPVTVTTRVGPGTSDIEVHNFGAPIAPSLLPVLFEPMTHGTSVTNEQRSVGLGLFIVRDIVRAHQGEVVVTSTSKSGTLFRTTFPRQLI